MSLPTFPELMASLQLSSKGEPEAGIEDHPDKVQSSSAPSSPTFPSPPSSPTAARQHPPSINDSPSIVVSQFESIRLTRPNEPRGQRSLGRSNRFAPYFGPAPNTQLRRSSVDVVSADIQNRDVPERASSASPKVRPATTLQEVNINARPPMLHKVTDIEPESDVPISSFARRRTPQSSPTASTFPHRRRSSSQASFSPVMLPSLPPGLASPSPPHTPDAMDMSEAEDHVLPQPQDLPKPRTRHKGLRLSSYRDHPQTPGQAKSPSVRSAA